MALTILHAGKVGGRGYKVSGGLRRRYVGRQCPIRVAGGLGQKRRSCIPKSMRAHYSVEEIGVSEDSGTIITFKPDYEIFEVEISAETIVLRLRELAFLNGGLTISLIDERTDEEQVFHNEGGIIDFVRFLNKNKNTLHSNPIYFKCEKDQVIIEVALQYNDSYIENIYSFANNIAPRKAELMKSAFAPH